MSQFGTWSHLGSTTSSATDVYPGTATLSFRTAVYHSTELTLRTTELADNAGRPLRAQTPLDTRVIDGFDVPPYVNSADQIASQLSNPWSPVAQAIDGSAQAIIAALDQACTTSRPRYEHRAYPAAETRPDVPIAQAQQLSRPRRSLGGRDRDARRPAAAASASQV